MNSYRSEMSSRRFPSLRLILILIGIIALFGVYEIVRHKTSLSVISPLAEEHTPSQSVLGSIFTKEKNPEDLKKKIANVVNNRWANYSVYVKDLNSNFTMGINENIIYTAASVNKLPILAALYYKAQRGDIDLDQIITVQDSDIQDYGTGTIRNDGAGTTYSIKTLAKLMIQQSDNTAAYILGNEVLTLDQIQTLVDSWGMTQTNMPNNKTSNKDIEVLMEKIYSGKIANQANTLEMLAFLKNTDFEDRIPALLPQSATVYHKIGTEIGVLHDTGIIEDGQKKFFLGILTSDVHDENEAVQISAQIAKTVYDFLAS